MGTTRSAYPCRWLWSLVLGKDRRGRVTTDTARAASVFVVCRSSFVPPTLGFGFLDFFWSLAGECGCVQVALAHAHAHAQTRPSCDGTGSVQRRVKGPGYLLAWAAAAAGRPRRIAHGPRSVLVLWGLSWYCTSRVKSRESRVKSQESRVESRESRVESRESRVTSRSPSPSQATLRGPTSFICMMHRI